MCLAVKQGRIQNRTGDVFFSSRIPVVLGSRRSPWRVGGGGGGGYDRPGGCSPEKD